MDSEIRQALAANVKRLRDARKWNQAALARKAGIGQSAVSYVERPEGKSPTLGTIKAIAQAFNVPSWTLLLPTSDVDAGRLRDFGDLVTAYSLLPESGRAQVLRVADAEARYAKAS